MIALTSSALAALLVLAGCASADTISGTGGGDTTSSSEPVASFNDPDVAFAMGMVDHHQQAIDMADMVLAKDGVDERVIALATDIKAAQAPEIQTMNAWLEDWGQPMDMSDMDHDGMMMGEDDMASLESATGPEASRLFLEQMIEHHIGAIDMAKGEIADGQNSDAVALAKKVIDDQTAELKIMQDLLASL